MIPPQSRCDDKPSTIRALLFVKSQPFLWIHMFLDEPLADGSSPFSVSLSALFHRLSCHS